MSLVISTGTAAGKFDLSQNDLKEFTYNLFSRSEIEIGRMISVFDNSEIVRRHISVSVDWLASKHSFSERNEIFREEAVSISIAAIQECFRKCSADYKDVDNIIFVTSTGLATPTIDAILFNKLGLNNHIKRTPLWGLGCAGGAVGISKAMEFTTAYPDKNVLVVAVELCSLTFQKDDLSKSNVVAASLFSDGAAAVLVAGEKSKLAGQGKIKLLDSLSTIYENSLDVMGWNIVNDGFSVLFSRDIPTIVRDRVMPNIAEIALLANIELSSLKHFITHPGGLKVINAYEESLELIQGTLGYSRKVLREHGNMSSPSVIFVLNEFLEDSNYAPNEYGILSALGPGFSSELVLFRTK